MYLVAEVWRQDDHTAALFDYVAPGTGIWRGSSAFAVDTPSASVTLPCESHHDERFGGVCIYFSVPIVQHLGYGTK